MSQVLNKIQNGFSQAASQYDHFASLHREIADKLLVRIAREFTPLTILDVGCGTGYLTVRLKDNFPQAEVIGLDFAQGMLEVARQKHDDIAWVLADGNNLPFSNATFDVLTSNTAYQWAEELSRVFSEACRVLTPDGVFACTIFGYNTCYELFQSLNEASGGTLQFIRLPDQAKIRESLHVSGFQDFKIDCEQIKVEFKDMEDLTAWFKYIGAPHLPREGYLGARTLSRAADIYRKKFVYLKGVGATFEVIRVYAKK